MGKCSVWGDSGETSDSGDTYLAQRIFFWEIQCIFVWSSIIGKNLMTAKKTPTGSYKESMRNFHDQSNGTTCRPVGEIHPQQKNCLTIISNPLRATTSLCEQYQSFFLDHEDAHTLFHSHLYVFMWSSNSFSRRKFQLEFATPAVTLENYTHYLHTGAIYIFNPVVSSLTNVRIAYCTYIGTCVWVSLVGEMNGLQ